MGRGINKQCFAVRSLTHGLALPCLAVPCLTHGLAKCVAVVYLCSCYIFAKSAYIHKNISSTRFSYHQLALSFANLSKYDMNNSFSYQ
jgi:hypothetical protein